MTDFMMIFRTPASDTMPTKEQMDAMKQDWMNWVGGIAAQGKYTTGNPLGQEGKVVQTTGKVSDGAFAQTQEPLSGFLLIKADSLSDAATLAQGCPVFSIGGNVEVRPVMPM